MNSIDAQSQGEGGETLGRRNSPMSDVLPDAVMDCADRFSACLAGAVDRATLRAAVREYARRVRGQQIPPERALAAFKAMLFSLPAIRLRGSEERVRLVTELARMSIEEYYAE